MVTGASEDGESGQASKTSKADQTRQASQANQASKADQTRQASQASEAGGERSRWRVKSVYETGISAVMKPPCRTGRRRDAGAEKQKVHLLARTNCGL
ncbi:hypothetical protein FHX76_000966 [Lysinibacter cavernae]|uniref:Uncharacterized protein n=1 Tax=Lysinibacter cavernae TaxID=1640652 RepID=A0A7X5R035_9MICO|nr:hypothetical protein [Lysinibacter cavernae]